MNTIEREQIWESLQDPEFRNQFIDEHIDVGIAFQIRSLRNRQQLKQSDLAQQMDVKQPLISAWENPNYGKYTLGTLKELAKAFDVGLLVRFVPFSKLVDWTVNLTNDAIAPPNFREEQYYAHLSSQLSTIMDSITEAKGIDANTSLNPIDKTQCMSTTDSIKEPEYVA
ncbi:MAG: helix-turn-helix transcriptional regulator [Dehalococcoidales bacterium]|nr:helix-turn-helix transcriptional regulator [Dehalococcoidales bacterium]